MRHLFENVVGLSNNEESQTMDDVTIAESDDLFDSSNNTENIDINSSPTKVISDFNLFFKNIFDFIFVFYKIKENKKTTFTEWFKENKAKLQNENPNATPQEITKLSVRKHKSVFINNTQKEDRIASGKRKSEDSQLECGISKLAKFGYTK